MRWGRSHDVPPRPARGTVVAGIRRGSVTLGQRTVLSDIDLSVRAGSLLTLVGPNGAGKSTLLSVLAGDIPLQSGAALLDGRAVGHWTPSELARRRAVLPQHHELAFPFTVAEVVTMGRAAWMGTPGEEHDDAAITQAMATAGILDLATRNVPSLSGGEQARTAFARVLAQRAPLLLLDEPTAALDLHYQELILTEARACARRGDAVVVVLHDLGAAAAYADEIALVADGRVRAHGDPEEVLLPPLLSEVYGHAIEVVRHPGSGVPLVLPFRQPASHTERLRNEERRDVSAGPDGVG